jgi:hypothetical protein
MSEIFMRALHEWIPLEVEGVYRVLRTAKAPEELFEAQGAMKMLQKLQRLEKDPAGEFGTLYPLNEEEEEKE